MAASEFTIPVENTSTESSRCSVPASLHMYSATTFLREAQSISLIPDNSPEFGRSFRTGTQWPRVLRMIRERHSAHAKGGNEPNRLELAIILVRLGSTPYSA